MTVDRVRWWVRSWWLCQTWTLMLRRWWYVDSKAVAKKRPRARRVRMLLRRHDGNIYLERWGAEAEQLAGLFLHRMDDGDPGVDLHDHPWAFVTLPLLGGYWEEREDVRIASRVAAEAEAMEADLARQQVKFTAARGGRQLVRQWRPRLMRLDEAHRITQLVPRRPGKSVWTLVVHGPSRRPWGFYLPDGWVDEHTYDETVRVNRRDLWNEEHPGRAASPR